MSPDGRVLVSNISGSVTVSGWDRPEVEVTGKLSDGVDRLLFEADGSDVIIEVMIEGQR